MSNRWHARDNQKQEKHMKDTTTKPKYTFKSLVDVLVLSLGLTVVTIMTVVRSGFNLQALSLLIMLIGFCFWWTHSLVRYFIFASSSFTVVRYIMPAITINYADVIDIGVTKIKTRVGNISLAGMSNNDVVINKFNDLINQGKINRNHLEKKIRTEETIWRKSLLPSLIISLPFGAMLFYYWPFDNKWFSPVGLGLACGLILYLVSFVVQRVVKKRLTNKKAG
jgi:heme/copper-type cytochrome/quinol oxidase subunit 4